MSVGLFTHPACLGHDPGMGHPECPDRLRAVLAMLEGPAFERLKRFEAPEVTRVALIRAHPQPYVEKVLSIRPAANDHVRLDPDTVMGKGSAEAALHAAGGVCAAVDAVMDGVLDRAFVAVRPPGHHAEPARAMGFCLFGNAAIGALQTRARGVRRVAVVDFDVHHGNGTQAMAWGDPDWFYASSHQMPLFPGTGAPAERGAADNVVNVSLPPGASAKAFRSAWTDVILPALRAFAPEFLIISAGFDAHRADPLAQQTLEARDFGWLTTELLRVGEDCAKGRVVSVLEGGYDLHALAESAGTHTRAMLNE